MPRRIVRIRRRAEKSGLRSEHVEYLFNGYNVSAMIGGQPQPTTDELRTLWGRHRARLLRWWFDGVPHGTFQLVHISFKLLRAQPPGTRPWAWWEFDAPNDGRRLLVVADMVPREGTPFHDSVERRATAEDLARISRDGKGGFGLPAGESGEWPHTFETEAEYLNRHGLLTAEERRAIKREDAEELAAQDTITNT